MAYDDQGFSIQLFEIGKIFGESPPQKTKEKKKSKNQFTLEIQKQEIPKLLPNVSSQKRKDKISAPPK